MTPEREALAALYRDVGAMFRYPDDATLRSQTQWRADPHAIETVEGLESVGARLTECLEALDANTPEALRIEYARVFIGPDPCCLNEGDFRGRAFDRTSILADVMGFYRAFGLDPDPDAGERADFIGTQLQFLCLLHIKEGLAVDSGLADEAQVCRDARRRFMEEHIGRWVPEFCADLRERSRERFYQALADTLAELIALEHEPTFAV